MIDRAGLEIRYTLSGIGGLNPSLSASIAKGSHNRFPFLVAAYQLLICILISGTEVYTEKELSNGR